MGLSWSDLRPQVEHQVPMNHCDMPTEGSISEAPGAHSCQALVMNVVHVAPHT